MSNHPLDIPQIITNLLYPRTASPGTHPDKNSVKDGFIPIDETINLGYRMYIHHSSAPVLLYFHGNGEIASDYDSLAPLYNRTGISLLVVDYRGYGWSSGSPLPSRLLPDAQVALEKRDDICRECGIIPGRPLFVKGRSLGSAAAIYLAQQNPDVIKGLIIESGYGTAPSLFARLGIPIPPGVEDDDTLPLNNTRKMQEIRLPLLVIHGALDTLIPATNAKELYEASPSDNKRLLIIPGAGHNNLLAGGIELYFNAIKEFVEAHL